MRILAIADVEEEGLGGRFDAERFRGIDLVLGCGDLPAGYLETVVTLVNRPLAYVRGNHDADYGEQCVPGCVDIDGHIRDFRGLRIMGLGGSLCYNGRVYGFSEEEMRARARRMVLLAQATGGVDVVITHAPPRGYGDLDDFPHRGFEAFNDLLDRLHPRYLVHGHVHMQYGRIPRCVSHPSGATVVNACGSYVLDIPDSAATGMICCRKLTP